MPSIHDQLVTEQAIHNIDGTDLYITFDQHWTGTLTASWWFPLPIGAVAWADGDGAGYPTREAAEQAAIEWAREHGPQR